MKLRVLIAVTIKFLLLFTSSAAVKSKKLQDRKEKYYRCKYQKRENMRLEENRETHDRPNYLVREVDALNVSRVNFRDHRKLYSSCLANKEEKTPEIKNTKASITMTRRKQRPKYVKNPGLEKSIFIDKKYDGTDFIISEKVYKEIQEYLTASTEGKPSKKTDGKAIEAAEDNVGKQSLALRLNVAYDRTYLNLEERMYTFNEKKLSILKDSFKIFIEMQKEVHCLVCVDRIPGTIQDVYEHIFRINHINKLEMLKNDEDRYKSMKQFIVPWGKSSVLCKCCKKDMKNSRECIDTHVKTKTHRKNFHKFHCTVNKMLNHIVVEMANYWYSIQRFSCVLCEENFNYKLEFLKHVTKKHKTVLDGTLYIFDLCIICATLWLGFQDSYPAHCNDIMHKYLTKTKMFDIDKLTKPVVDLLNRVDEIVNDLFERTEAVFLDVKIQKQIELCLKNTLKSSLLDIQIYFFGSRVTGLGFPDSDIDIYIKATLNNETQSKYDNVEGNDVLKLLSCIHCALTENKRDWTVKEMLENTRTPIIKLVHKPTNVDCDISVTNSLSVENSKLIRYFNEAYPPCRKLILFLKKWLSLCKLTGNNGVTNYALVWHVIFFLQQHKTIKLPSVAQLIKEQNKSQIINGWETGVARPKCEVKVNFSIRQLLLQFFKYYETFDYRYYVVCPLMGAKLAKKNFAEPNTLPAAMGPYTKRIESSTPEYFRIDSPMCIQDPFDLSHNLTKAVRVITLKQFKQYCKESAKILSKS